MEVAANKTLQQVAAWKLPPLTDDGGVTHSGHLMLVPREGHF